VVVQNRNRVSQQTFGPVTMTAASPAWVTEQAASPADIAYLLNLQLDPVTYDYQADHVFLHMSAVAVSGNTYELDVVAPFSSGAGFDAPAGREPYADVSWAHAWFYTRLEGKAWEAFDERDQLMALITASDDLDKEVYKGEKWFYDTPFLVSDATGTVEKWRYRQFPRLIPEFSFIEQLAPDDQDTIPQDMKEACCVQALFLLQTFSVGQDANQRRNLQQFGVSGFQGQGSSEAWDLARQPLTRICQAALDHIRKYLLTAARAGFFD